MSRPKSAISSVASATQQVQAVHRDLLGFQQQTGQRFDRVSGRLDRIEQEVRGVKADVGALRKDLPSIVGDAMREVLREEKE
jgi:hypothetical protein